jgi:glycosyltransferase involved in cell wall biosynthesis
MEFKNKGIRQYIEAAKIIKKKYPNVRFQLLGPIESENRTAIPINEIKQWQEK